MSENFAGNLRKRLAHAATLGLATSMLLTSAPVAYAATTEDRTGPVITASSFTVVNANLNTGPGKILFSISAKDISGVRPPSTTVTYESDKWPQGTPEQQIDISFKRTSGTDKNGTWIGELNIPVGSPPGTISANYVSVQDSIGNSADASKVVFDYEAPKPFKVPITASKYDLVGPVLSQISISSTSVDSSAKTQDLIVSFRATDATGTVASKFDHASLTFDTRSTYQSLQGTQFRKISGTAKDGVWQSTIKVPTTVYSGTWQLDAEIADEIGNSSSIFDFDRQSWAKNIKSSPSITVKSGPKTDTQPPEMIDVKVNNTHVNTANGLGLLSVQMRLRDPAGVADAPSFWMVMDSEGSDERNYRFGAESNYGRMKLVSGTKFDGLWELKAKLPDGMASGTWELAYWGAHDELYNTNASHPEFAQWYPISLIEVESQTPKPFPPLTTPMISGSYAVGKTLKLSNNLGAPSGANYAYQWLRDNEIIAGAWKPSYVLTASDHGKKISLKVTAEKFGFTTQTLQSNVTFVVAAGTMTQLSMPTISGAPQVGNALKASVGPWATSGAKISYQWLRNGKAISGATKSSYKLVAADRGAKVSVRVTGSKTGYVSVSKTSAATRAVKAR